jgi:hypothetical protein
MLCRNVRGDKLDAFALPRDEDVLVSKVDFVPAVRTLLIDMIALEWRILRRFSGRETGCVQSRLLFASVLKAH